MKTSQSVKCDRPQLGKSARHARGGSPATSQTARTREARLARVAGSADLCLRAGREGLRLGDRRRLRHRLMPLQPVIGLDCSPRQIYQMLRDARRSRSSASSERVLTDDV